MLDFFSISKQGTKVVVFFFGGGEDSRRRRGQRQSFEGHKNKLV